MVRHIVFFNMKESSTTEDKNKLIADLTALKDKIDLIKELEVGIDVGGKPNSFDLALNSLFESMEDVETYIKDPEHTKVVEFIKLVCESTCKTDYYI